MIKHIAHPMAATFTFVALAACAPKPVPLQTCVRNVMGLPRIQLRHPDATKFTVTFCKKLGPGKPGDDPADDPCGLDKDHRETKIHVKDAIAEITRRDFINLTAGDLRPLTPENAAGPKDQSIIAGMKKCGLTVAPSVPKSAMPAARVTPSHANG